MQRAEIADVIIVGAGPAGLSAALILGRCGRRVRIFDDDEPRNARSAAVHGFFSRDGSAPRELLRIGREQLTPYGLVVERERVTDVAREGDVFHVQVASGAWHYSLKLVLATGLVDVLPPIDGIEQYYGRGAFHCPYCDGWEVRGRRLVACGQGEGAVELALGLTTWSADVVLCARSRLSAALRRQLDAHGVTVHADTIVRCEGRDGRLERLALASGSVLECGALFFSTPTRQRSSFAAKLGCQFTRKGAVKTGAKEETGVPGLYVVGDASKDMNFVAVAVAEGTKAGAAVNRALREDWARARTAELKTTT